MIRFKPGLLLVCATPPLLICHSDTSCSHHPPIYTKYSPDVEIPNWLAALNKAEYPFSLVVRGANQARCSLSGRLLLILAPVGSSGHKDVRASPDTVRRPFAGVIGQGGDSDRTDP